MRGHQSRLADDSTACTGLLANRYTNWVKTNFFKWTTDDDILVVLLEPAAGSKLGDDAGTSVLGLMCVNVIGPSETYWHSLRVRLLNQLSRPTWADVRRRNSEAHDLAQVHPALRNKGCGRALFGAVQDLFFRLNVRSLLLRQPASLTRALL